MTRFVFEPDQYPHMHERMHRQTRGQACRAGPAATLRSARGRGVSVQGQIGEHYAGDHES